MYGSRVCGNFDTLSPQEGLGSTWVCPTTWISRPQQVTALTSGHVTGVTIFHVWYAEETIWKFSPRQASHLQAPGGALVTLSLCLELKRLSLQGIISFTLQILTQTSALYLFPLFQWWKWIEILLSFFFLPFFYPYTVNPSWFLVSWSFLNSFYSSRASHLSVSACSVASPAYTHGILSGSLCPLTLLHSYPHIAITTLTLWSSPIKECSVFPWCEWHKMNSDAWFFFPNKTVFIKAPKSLHVF